MQTRGTLYVIGTPIGHLADLTYRAHEILGQVSLVACEDTRVTKTLLDHYHLTTPTTSLHQHSDDKKIAALVTQLEAGGDIALVTDAGTPGIADPGGKFIAAVISAGIRVVTVPGPSAVAAALSISGFPADQFLFLGFLPHKKGRQTLFKKIAATAETVVVYESPHRILKSLVSLQEVVPERSIAVCRELTKIHESVIRGTPGEVLKHLTDHPDQVRGEIVIVIGPQ